MTEQTDNTLGSWAVEVDQHGHQSIVAIDHNDPRIHRFIGYISDPTGMNARLIAAAPALLEACRAAADEGHTDACQYWDPEIGRCNCMLADCRAAIALATGEQP